MAKLGISGVSFILRTKSSWTGELSKDVVPGLSAGNEDVGKLRTSFFLLIKKRNNRIKTFIISAVIEIQIYFLSFY
jgi:hypothetical protein